MSKVSFSSVMSGSFYAERRVGEESGFDRLVGNILGNAARIVHVRSQRFAWIVEKVNALGPALQGRPDNELIRQAGELRRQIHIKGLTTDLVAETFGLVREFAHRKIGQRHFDVQIMGGWLLLKGMLAEMETGEGKTLTATLAASSAALAGIPVHVITVNDYLAQRDAEMMRPLYESLGISVGVVSHEMGLEDRRRAYRCDVTYCTNKEVVFDYLKDRLLMGQQPGHIQLSVERLNGGNVRLDRLRLRGLYFAIVDEADSVLIDEARTPLIISAPGENGSQVNVYLKALDLADQLGQDEDYTVDLSRRSLELTDSGRARLERMVQGLGGFWSGRLRREEMIHQALMAKLLFIKDREYLVRDGKVQIIDEYTGRLMADRSWEGGLHQLIEAKELCELSQQNETLARISYQRFFRRYIRLAGMTGTAKEVAKELWEVYRLQVVRVPTNKPRIRCAFPTRVYQTGQERWAAVVERIASLHRQGRPILVGTRSVGASEHLSSLLVHAVLPHRVLNASQDKEEADIISHAGERGGITVATNMAGRGTDILIGVDVKALGGLHVIATERHDARRIDRQLFGRCGRQGNPGSFESVASLQDDLLAPFMRTFIGFVVGRWVNAHTRFGRTVGRMLAAYAQRSAERKHFISRRELLKMDESRENAMSFSGLVE